MKAVGSGRDVPYRRVPKHRYLRFLDRRFHRGTPARRQQGRRIIFVPKAPSRTLIR